MDLSLSRARPSIRSKEEIILHLLLVISETMEPSALLFLLMIMALCIAMLISHEAQHGHPASHR